MPGERGCTWNPSICSSPHIVTLGDVEKGCRIWDILWGWRWGDRMWKREEEGMVRRGGKWQQRKHGRVVRAGEAHQQGNMRQVDKGRNTLYQQHTSGIGDTLCASVLFYHSAIHAFCATLLLLCAFAQQILLSSQLSTHRACNTPRQLQLPFQAVLETREKGKEKNLHSARPDVVPSTWVRK